MEYIESICSSELELYFVFLCYVETLYILKIRNSKLSTHSLMRTDTLHDRDRLAHSPRYTTKYNFYHREMMDHTGQNHFQLWSTLTRIDSCQLN